MPWFSNRGQIFQLIVAVGALCYTARSAFQSMLANEFFSFGAIVFYFLLGLVLVSVWLLVRPGSTSQIKLELVLHETYVDYDDKPDIYHKMKLRVEFQNESSDCIEVDEVKWDPGPKGIPSDPVRGKAWRRVQVRRAFPNLDPKIDPRWYAEEERAHVPFGERFRVTVALDPAYGNAKIKQSIADSETGTVSLRVRIAQRSELQHFRV